MISAAEAGITPREFYQMTVREVLIAIEAYGNRERNTLISRVSAVVRGLSTLGKGPSDPFRGLVKKNKELKRNPAFDNVARQVFKAGSGETSGRVNQVRQAFQQAKERWFWGD